MMPASVARERGPMEITMMATTYKSNDPDLPTDEFAFLSRPGQGDAGHFAFDEQLDTIAELTRTFLLAVTS
jgi:hypothetical protein